MLAAREHTLALEPLRESRAELSDLHRVPRERAIADHGVVRVAVHIQNRRKIDVEPDRTQLRTENATGSARESRVTDVTERAHRRELHHRGPEPHDAAALLVHREERPRMT